MLGNTAKSPTPEDFAFSRLLSYCAYQWPQYQIGQHHRKIAEALEKVESGEIKRLMITMPPRHGKSMLASEYFPAWYLGRNPDHYVICASYSQDLADDFGRKVRNQITGPDFLRVFPGVSLSQDSTSAKRFNTTANGSYFAVGVGGPVTGRGAHLLLIDDPVKNREDADSEVNRKKVKDWYTSTAYTRLMPGGRIVVIQTRWHEDDLSGWLLSEQKHEGWVILNLPATNDDETEALWPDQYPIERLKQIKETIGARDWSALYQQRPTPDTGDYFKREWVRYYADKPKSLRYYGASDYAVSSGEGDYTVHGVFGVDDHDNLYVVDWYRDQVDSAAWVDAFISMVQRWSPVQWAEEAGPIQKSLQPFISKRMKETNTYCTMKQYPSVHDKQTRAQAIRGRISQGRVFFPKTDWSDQLVNEMMTFPAGKHDDGVDVLSLFGRMINDATPKKDKWDKPLKINTKYVV